MSPSPQGSLRLTAAMCIALVLTLSGSLSFQALIPTLIPEWALDHAGAGWLASVSYVAYAVTAPFLVGMTDRVDARRVFVAAALLSALAAAGFALFARDFWSALPWRALTGVGVAGSYMPGLKALSDRSGVSDGRPQSLYTASYALGSALSLGTTGLLADAFGWRAALLAVTGLSLAGALIAFTALDPRRPPTARTRTLAASLLRAVRDRESMRYVLAYTFHTFELFAFRTWIVALLAFAFANSGTAAGLGTSAALATALLLFGLPASLIGNELASRMRRERALVLMMVASASGALLVAFAVGASPGLLLAAAALYTVLVTADAAAIMVGTLAAAPPERRGATIAVQTLLAALAALVSPLLFGYTLDLFGGNGIRPWRMAFVALAAVALTGAVVLAASGRRRGS